MKCVLYRSKSEPCCCAVLTKFMQSIMPTGKSSWMIHVLGLERLFALQGPLITEKSTALDRLLVDSCRPLMILAAFFTQRPSLMGKPEWKVTTPPSLISNAIPHVFQTSIAVSDVSFLMGILAELPAIFLQCDECIRLAKRMKHSPHTQVSMIWYRVEQLEREVRVWKDKWIDNNPKEVCITSPATMIGSTQDIAGTKVFQFGSVELATTFTMYHTVLILLRSIPISLLKAGLELSFSASTTTSDYDGMLNLSQLISDVRISVRSICRSMQYYIHFLRPSQAPVDFYLFFPMHVARRASTQLGYSPELAWLIDAFEVMRSSYPMGVWAHMDFANRFSGLHEGLFG